MIKATRNQLHNVGNKYQTEVKKVLTVCSAGLLRSPTIAKFLSNKYGYNTRSCGTSDFALIPLSEALIIWADEIIVAHKDVLQYLSDEAIKIMDGKTIVLNIKDLYNWNDDDLIKEIESQYGEQNDS